MDRIEVLENKISEMNEDQAQYSLKALEKVLKIRLDSEIEVSDGGIRYLTTETLLSVVDEVVGVSKYAHFRTLAENYVELLDNVTDPETNINYGFEDSLRYAIRNNLMARANKYLKEKGIKVKYECESELNG